MSPTAPGERTRRLTEISRALTYARSLEDVLDLTVDCATELLDAEQALLMLSDERGLLHIRAARGLDTDVVARFQEPLDENLLDRLSGVLGPDAKERFLGVPLVVRGSVIGLLGVHYTGELNDFDESEWLLSALADQASVALESTRHQAARDELSARLETLQRSDKQREHALEILGHDLRSPLNAVLGYAALMSAEILGPINTRQRDALTKLKRVTAHLESIVNNVLEMARLNSGRLEFSPSRFGVRTVIEEAMDVVTPAAAEADITIEYDGDDALTIETDSGHLRQVVVQLIDNAVKYAPAGTRVTITWQRAHEDGHHWVEISVADQGPGIPAGRQKEIFEPYVRRSGDSARAQTGVGLGLAIASGVVKRLGGVLLLHSEPGEGAVFIVRLPAN